MALPLRIQDGEAMNVFSRAQAMQITETKAIVSEIAIGCFREVLMEQTSGL